jgi:hypothetical protein
MGRRKPGVYRTYGCLSTGELTKIPPVRFHEAALRLRDIYDTRQQHLDQRCEMPTSSGIEAAAGAVINRQVLWHQDDDFNDNVHTNFIRSRYQYLGLRGIAAR